jgi:hypothetical protein
LSVATCILCVIEPLLAAPKSLPVSEQDALPARNAEFEAFGDPPGFRSDSYP